MKKRIRRLLPFIALVFILAACSPAATAPVEDVASEPSDSAADEVVVTQVIEGETVIEGTATFAPQPTQPAVVSPTPEIPRPTVSPPPVILEDRMIEVEWPPDLALDESDVVRLTFNPVTGDIETVVEQPGNLLVEAEVQVKQIEGYRASAIASLDGVGFQISPSGEQERVVTEGEPLTWRWTVTPLQTGRQTLSLPRAPVVAAE